LYYVVEGEGPPLLLIHAGVADSRMWKDQVETFAGRYQVVRYDMRGYGRTKFPGGSYANHEDAAGLLDYLGLDVVRLVGISFGGRVALDFALAYPDRVEALVLGAPALDGYPVSPEVEKFGAEEEAFLERGDLTAATELNLRMWVDGPHRTPDQVSPTVRERVREMQYHAFNIPFPEGAKTQFLDPPAIERLAGMQTPTLILIGDLDVPWMLAIANHLSSHFPGAQQKTIPGVAHLLNMEKPELFNKLVLEFFREVKV
jgi:pimeloyl-ACP methyl ester carboxylesterase